MVENQAKGCSLSQFAKNDRRPFVWILELLWSLDIGACELVLPPLPNTHQISIMPRAFNHRLQNHPSVCCLDFSVAKFNLLTVKRRMILSFLIGVGITALGGLSCFILIWFYSDLDGHHMTNLEVCLELLMRVAWFPALVVGGLFFADDPGSFGMAIVLVITALFWGLVIQCLWYARRLMKRPGNPPNQ
jgi:hypothetical protein